MRKLLNTEITKFIFEEMEKKNKNYEINFSKILQMTDDSIEYNNDYEKDENGDILNELSEQEIKNLKESMLDGVEEYFDEIYSLKMEAISC